MFTTHTKLPSPVEEEEWEEEYEEEDEEKKDRIKGYNEDGVGNDAPMSPEGKLVNRCKACVKWHCIYSYPRVTIIHGHVQLNDVFLCVFCSVTTS